MTKRTVRIEEVFVLIHEDFSQNEWIESETLQVGDTLNHKNQTWIVVEVSK